MKADDGAAVEVRFTDYTCAQCRSGSLTLASLDHALPKNPQCPPSIRSPREAEGNMRPSLFRRRKMIPRDILRQGTCINAPGTSLIGERSSQIAQNRARTIYHCPNRDLKRDLFYEIFHAWLHLRLVISLVQLAFDRKRWNLRHRRSAPT